MEGARQAGRGDLAACAGLLDAARASARAARGGPELLAASPLATAPAPVDSEWLARHWNGPDHLLLAGTIDDAVVGVALGHLATPGDERVGVVDCCYVQAEAREVGVGTALVESLVAWFAAAGCVAVDAPALPGDRATKQLFESQGLSARLLVLHRRLP